MKNRKKLQMKKALFFERPFRPKIIKKTTIFVYCF